MRKKRKANNVFAICLFISFILHLGGIFFIQKYSLWFYSPINDSTLSQDKLLLPKIEKQKVLKQVTDQIKIEKKIAHYLPVDESVSHFISDFDLDLKIDQNIFHIKNLSFDSLKWRQTEKFPESKLLTIHQKMHSDIIQEIKSAIKTVNPKIEVKDVAAKHRAVKQEAPIQYLPDELLTGKIDPIKIQKMEKIFNTETLTSSIPLIHSPPKASPQKKIQSSHAKLPSLDRMNTYLYADDFDIEVTSIKNEKEEGYIFAVTLIPKMDIDLKPIKQNFFFLMDRSNTIQKNRLKASRDAIYRALSFLKNDDTFNIIAFDSKVEKLFIEQKKFSNSLKEKAKKFLINQRLASFFASPNIYNSLHIVSNQEKNDDGINTIILLSNGDGLVHKALQHYFMGQWSSLNYGKASLFSIAMEEDPHITDLELISVLNRGWLVSSSTRGGIKRKLMKLMKTIQNPIMKDVACTAISKTPDHPIELFRPFKQLPHLYAHEPYVIIGKCSRLEDFVLVLQGKNQDKWINIKKVIHLSNFQDEDESLKEQWALQKAWNCYRNYLYDTDRIHLQEAKEILEPYDIPPAFQ